MMKRFYFVASVMGLSACAFAQEKVTMEKAPQLEVAKVSSVRSMVTAQRPASVFRGMHRAPAADYVLWGINYTNVFNSGWNTEGAYLIADAVVLPLGQNGYFRTLSNMGELVNAAEWKYDRSGNGEFVDMEVGTDIPYPFIPAEESTVLYPQVSVAGDDGVTYTYDRNTAPEHTRLYNGATTQSIVSRVYDEGYGITAGFPSFSGVGEKNEQSIFGSLRLQNQDGTIDTLWWGSDWRKKGYDKIAKIATHYLPTTVPFICRGVTVMLQPSMTDPNAPILSGDARITASLYTLTEDLQFDKLLGQASVTADDLSNNGESAMVNFTFSYIDEISGAPIAEPVGIPQNVRFAVVLEGLENANFMIPQTMGTNNTAQEPSFLVDIKGKVLNMGGYDETPYYSFTNPTIVLQGYFPGAKNSAGGIYEVPATGGYGIVGGQYQDDLFVTAAKQFDALGNANWKLEYPDWVKPTINEYMGDDNGGWDSYHAYSVQFEAEAYDGNRQGFISFYFPKTKSRFYVGQIGQGEWTPAEYPSDEVSIETVKAAEAGVSVANVGGDFALNYTEDYNAVRVINLSGAVVASYELPVGGAFTVPANDLAKGVYLLQFAGAKNYTVKVVK